MPCHLAGGAAATCQDWVGCGWRESEVLGEGGDGCCMVRLGLRGVGRYGLWPLLLTSPQVLFGGDVFTHERRCDGSRVVYRLQ